MPFSFSSSPTPLHPLLLRALEQARDEKREVLVRLPEPHAPQDPWRFGAASLASGERVSFWAHPDDKLVVHGVGQAVCFSSETGDALGELGRRQKEIPVHAHPDLRALPLWFGGFSFDADARQRAPWTGWPTRELLTHAVTAIRHASQRFLILSLLVQPHDDETSLRTKHHDLRAWLHELMATSGNTDAHLGLQFSNVDQEKGWEEHIHTIHAAVQHQDLQKLVLARRAVAGWPSDATANDRHTCTFAALEQLRRRYPQCTTFAIGRTTPQGESIFFGSTPELLIKRQGDKLSTMALAGTMPRGDTMATDTANERTLLGSSKDREEHAFVVRNIRDNLQRIGIDAHVPSTPDIVSFPNVHHLQTRIRANAPADLHLLDIAEALHPTPAICGTPTHAARLWLRENEDLDRGWYAGGIMWLNDLGDGSVNVALRSGIADPKGVYAYAGAGIVKDSDPEQEWLETEAKLQPIRHAFMRSDSTSPPVH